MRIIKFQEHNISDAAVIHYLKDIKEFGFLFGFFSSPPTAQWKKSLQFSSIFLGGHMVIADKQT